MNRLKFLIVALTFLLPLPTLADENVVVVWDGSGSMDAVMENNKTRMENAKTALKSVLLKLPDRGVNVGIIVFEANNVQDDWIYPLGPIDKEKLSAAIDQPSPGGGTPLADYIKAGVDALLQKRKQREGIDTYKLLIVTDGVASGPIRQYAIEALMQGVSINCIGLDMESDHELASLATDNTNFAYADAKDVNILQSSIAEVFSEINPENPDVANEVFEELAGLPDGVAEAMIVAMSRSGTIPIGERPSIQVDETGVVEIADVESSGNSILIVVSIIMGGLIIFGILVLTCGR